jgi:hypothetical protein
MACAPPLLWQLHERKRCRGRAVWPTFDVPERGSMMPVIRIVRIPVDLFFENRVQFSPIPPPQAEL